MKSVVIMGVLVSISIGCAVLAVMWMPPQTSAVHAAPMHTPTPTASPAAIAANAPAVPDLLAQVDAARMMATVRQLMTYGNRHAKSPVSAMVGIHAAAEYLYGEFNALQAQYPAANLQVGLQAVPVPITPGYDATIHNIFLTIPGRDPNAGVVVIGAHYDTIGRDPESGIGLQPGADDNGSGVAAVLEIARILAAYPPRVTVIAVLFAGEEVGRLGSQIFVEQIVRTQGIPVHAMLNLDMIGVPAGPDGAYDPGTVRVYSAPPSDSGSRYFAQWIAATAALYTPGLRVDVYDTLDRAGRWGDHQSFSDAGYAAARLIEPFDDPARMHNLYDNAEVLDLDYWRAVTQLALAVAATY